MEKNHLDIENNPDDGLTFKISRFNGQIKNTKPHKHDEYYELIFLSNGEGFYCIEADKYMISAPEFYFLKPGQLLFWEFTSVPKGFVISFKLSEFDVVEEYNLLEMYRKLLNTTRLKLKALEYPENILNEILNEFRLDSKYSKEILHGLLMALFGRLLQKAECSPHKPEIHQTMYDKFQTLIVQECPRLHKVNEFAELLNITPQNLNAICRKQSGKSAHELINCQILLEAKRYLLHTDNTINEIADILSFCDASHFVKFFKKSVRLTPFEFREEHFQ